MNMGDTNTTPFDTVTHASRGTYCSGQAVQLAAKKVKDEILEWSSKLMNVPKENLDIKDSNIFIKNGNFKSSYESISIEKVVQSGQSKGWGTIIASANVRPIACPPHFVVCFVELEVDTRTGKVNLKKIVQGADAGTIIYPDGLKGQIIGALHMGFGYALTEEVIIDQRTGEVINSNLADYKMLTFADMPIDIDVFAVESYEKSGPFGAKGIGEGATSCVAAAVGNAIYNAVGVRVRDLPISAEKIFRALKNK
jgi:CO/xanthine dehydrogenase Mo-binding subunit